jgi:transposase
MCGADTFTESLFSMHKLDDFVPKSHPLRSIRVMANEALVKMDRLFAGMYEADIKGGRPSIAPEKLMRAMLIQVLYSIRSERQLMEQVQYNLLFGWFIGLAMDDEVWVPTVFTKNRERLIKHDAVIEFFSEVVAIAEKKCLLSGEHFSVDGTPVTIRTTMVAARVTSKATNAAARRISRRLIQMPGSIAKAKRPANYGTWAIR